MFSESIRVYVCLILSSQVPARSNMLGNLTNVLTAQQAFMNNFGEIINRCIDIRKEIKRYQDTLNYVNCNVFILPCDMNFNFWEGNSKIQ